MFIVFVIDYTCKEKLKKNKMMFLFHFSFYYIYRRVISSRVSFPIRRGRTFSVRRASPTLSDSDSRASSRMKCSRNVILSRTTFSFSKSASIRPKTWPSKHNFFFFFLKFSFFKIKKNQIFFFFLN